MGLLGGLRRRVLVTGLHWQFQWGFLAKELVAGGLPARPIPQVLQSAPGIPLDSPCTIRPVWRHPLCGCAGIPFGRPVAVQQDRLAWASSSSSSSSGSCWPRIRESSWYSASWDGSAGRSSSPSSCYGPTLAVSVGLFGERTGGRWSSCSSHSSGSSERSRHSA